LHVSIFMLVCFLSTFLEYFEYFCQISSKSILLILSYTVSKFVHFFETRCSDNSSINVVKLKVHENEPVRLEGVARSGERTQDVVGKRGTIKNIAGRFNSPQTRDSSSDDSSDDDDDASRRRPAPSRRPVAATRDTGGSDAVVLSENVPTELDPNVVRSANYRSNDPVMESGRTRSMAERWRQQQEQDASAASTSGSRSGKPAWLIELENAKETESGVFENEPEV